MLKHAKRIKVVNYMPDTLSSADTGICIAGVIDDMFIACSSTSSRRYTLTVSNGIAELSNNSFSLEFIKTALDLCQLSIGSEDAGFEIDYWRIMKGEKTSCFICENPFSEGKHELVIVREHVYPLKILKKLIEGIE